jgi:hypothetical protein
MHAFQINSQINENGILSVKLPKELTEKDLNKEFIKVPDLLVENWVNSI